MTIQGAIAELQNLINADDVPFYYKGCIEKVIETISTEIPTTEQSSTVENKCDTCCQYKIGFEDGKLEMIRMIEDALKGKKE